jgi:hypothetical protein
MNPGQITNQWSSLEQIPNYQDTSRAPLMVADRDNNIHLFNYEALTPLQNAIFYRSWNPQSGWTPPVDIVLVGLGGGPQTLQGVVIDDQQMIHMIFYIGTEDSGDLYYTFAPAFEANDATAWAKPFVIGKQAGPLPFANLTIDKGKELTVFYGSELEGNGLYMVRSVDYGKNWTQPLPLFMVTKTDYWPAAIRATTDADGIIHVVWSLVGTLGVGEEIHYARLNADFNKFEIETIIAKREGSDYSTTWPDIISDGDQLILLFQDSFPATRFMTISEDHGNSWSFPVQPFDYIGEYEFTSMAKDSSGVIHLVLGNRFGNPEIHGMWYSKWLGKRWSALEPITSGPVTKVYDPSAPQSIILQGNILFATWWNNVQRENLSGAWYSYKLLDAPQLSLTPNAQPSLTPTLVTEISASKTVEPAITNTAQINAPNFNLRKSSYLPASTIFFGFVPAVVFIIVFYMHKKKQG